MLSALHYAVDLIREHRGYEIDLATIPQEDDVYAMLCRADTVGVFQIESRAQMATLPRLKPRRFYDLVVEVALIRPGPIQGGSVHPYIRRRNGQEPITYLHPLLENSLGKTLGVPLFQEQLMQMAIDVAGFTPTEADQLRQAMGSKRSRARMEKLKARLYEGMAERNITGDVADEIFTKMAAFANYGFPESHSVSFSYLVYASSWIKFHEPAAFCAALLNAQPMGFWSPHSLAQDATRHGVVVQVPGSQRVAGHGNLGAMCGVGRRCGSAFGDRLGSRCRHRTGQGDRGRPAVRVARRSGASGAVSCNCNNSRRWRRPGCSRNASGSNVVRRCGRSVAPCNRGRIVCRGSSPGSVRRACPAWIRWRPSSPICGQPVWRPMAIPPSSCAMSCASAAWSRRTGLWDCEPKSKVLVAGIVTHRQRPMTAQGVTFMNLEDETGLINIVVSKGCWARYRTIARSAPALLIRGRLERAEGVINIVADELTLLPVRGIRPPVATSAEPSLVRRGPSSTVVGAGGDLDHAICVAERRAAADVAAPRPRHRRQAGQAHHLQRRGHRRAGTATRHRRAHDAGATRRTDRVLRARSVRRPGGRSDRRRRGHA